MNQAEMREALMAPGQTGTDKVQKVIPGFRCFEGNRLPAATVCLDQVTKRGPGMYTLVRANVEREPDLILRWCPVGLGDVVEQDSGGCDEILR